MKRMLYVLIVFVLANLTFAQTVTFKVDMRIKTKKGQFNPASDTLRVAGSFNGWSTTADDLVKGTDTVYTLTKTFAVNDTLTFKFFASGSLGWEGDPNRVHVVTAGAQTYTAFFNRDSIFSTPKAIQLRFIANMEFEIAAGRFNPQRPDTLTVRGDFNGWGGSTLLTPGITNPSIYNGVFQDTLGEGETLNMKLAYITAGGTTWENDPNKTYTITAADYAAGFATISRTFNDLTLANVTNAPCTITFQVNMDTARSAVSGLPFTSVENVIIAGANAPLQWPDGGWPTADSNKVIKLYNDGTHGDSLAGDKVWTAQITFPKYSPLQIEYKYGANFGLPLLNGGGNDNEGGVGGNHLINLTPRMLSASVKNQWSVVGLASIYNVVTGINDAISTVNNYSLSQNYPNPFNPSTSFSYSIAERGAVSLKVYDVLGKEVATLVNGEMEKGSYVVNFNASNLASGLYIYTLKAGSTSITKKMLLMK